ncbi:MAG: hypothetical protein H6684_14810 [Deltaproteobacteria bacterium]|nr:hypothetical protein [Deltaproteobacteria bacterium]
MELTVFLLNDEGQRVFEKSVTPVDVEEHFAQREEGPLKPGYSRKVNTFFSDAPSTWNKKDFEIEIGKIVFDEHESASVDTEK